LSSCRRFQLPLLHLWLRCSTAEGLMDSYKV
jgi:hypothetical protein